MVAFVLTLSGAAQPLIAAGVSGDIPCRQIHLQADSANSNLVKVGGPLDVSGTVYGILIPIPVTNIPAVPIVFGAEGGGAGGIKPSSIAVFGTLNEKLRVTLIPF